ncbi:ThiF family adenylyltransferase [Compostimonas suwonensis]|uniref:Adenylyltransferase/sulfurtransferase n=1 Tax=Compostimonas suwonensis TaxID=1048394 RepID=A0A2M9BU08_9MICO|nr:ThiF family adenylyltransferase [Compostimonas suwonensis]PJJ61438.1 adenylyltransferase/sulfurtransferase [Compostimonas suwonensis]
MTVAAQATPLPPLVAAADTLTAEELTRYSRQIVLPGFGPLGQGRLANARVLVVGAGGLGSATITALAALGVGTVGIVDADIVELSNLPRQSIHDPGSVGAGKAASAAASVRALATRTRAVVHDLRLTRENALGILGDYDLVLDGSDNFATRYLVNDAAAILGTPLVWGAVHRFGGQAGVCWAVHGPQYRDLFPQPPEPGSVPSCEEAGVLPSVCAVVGGIMVGEAVKLITGTGRTLLGRVTSYDALTGGFRELAYERDPEGAPITELVDYDAFCGTTPPGDTAGTVVRPTSITAPELARRLAAGEQLTVVDVREPWEAEIASIPGGLLKPLPGIEGWVGEVPAEGAVVLYCHHGIRSETARRRLAASGVEALSLTGGIDAWSLSVDPRVARY